MIKINDTIIEQTIQGLQIAALNSMQQEVIFTLRKHKGDLVLLSPTGTGKTLAYLLPLRCSMDPAITGVQAVVVVPTRELAMQIEQVFRSLGSGMKVNCCYGGKPMHAEKRSLEHAPALVVATPGRLLDHLQRQNIDPTTIHTIVLDEFDKSLEMGFQDEMNQIISLLPAIDQRILTSATDSREIPNFLGLRDSVRIDYLSDSATPEELSIYKVFYDGSDKTTALTTLISNLEPGSTLIFCNQRESVERVSQHLSRAGIVCDFLHGGLEQPERERALCRFRNGSLHAFVSTDLAARGLDIPEVKYVIHYDMPQNEEAFTHRNGRTARMNATGAAFLLLSKNRRNRGEQEPEDQESQQESQSSSGIPTMELDPSINNKYTPQMSTLYISVGKRDKVNKVDVVGFLIQKGLIEKSDIGLIEIKNAYTFVAVNRQRIEKMLHSVEGEKIKGNKAKFEIID